MGRLISNCQDPRFKNVEKRLFNAIGYALRHGNIAGIGIPELSSRAKVWDSTFYDHFKNVDDALERYNHCHDVAIKKLRDEIAKEHISTETAILKLLYFIKKHKNYYHTVLYRQNPIPIFSISKIFSPLITKSWYWILAIKNGVIIIFMLFDKVEQL